ncbi:MAG TPA: hypothetical protein VHZ95_22375 [Polyangiales bacterium]|jgi:hypothetical protein|nr:hypothetical protein [Polyangiales bacterium]
MTPSRKVFEPFGERYHRDVSIFMTDDEHDLTSDLESAYRRGDFARVRAEAARALAEPTIDAASREDVRRQLERTRIDRGSWIALAFAALLFCAIVLRYVL